MDDGLAAEYAVSDVVPMLTRGQFIDGSAGTASLALYGVGTAPFLDSTDIYGSPIRFCTIPMQSGF